MAYRRTEKITARLAANRQAILKAAERLMRNHGFSGTKMSAIAAAAGLSTGTIYRYFPSRNELFVELFRIISGRELAVIGDIAASPAPPRDRLTAMITTFLNRAQRSQGIAPALTAEPLDPALETERLHFRARYRDHFRQVLEDGIAQGSFRPMDAETAACGIVGALGEIIAGGGGTDNDGTDLGEALDFILGAVAPQNKDRQR